MARLTLEQAMKAQRGNRSMSYSFFNLGARWGWVVNAAFRRTLPSFPPGARPAADCIGSRVSPRFWSPDRPARSESVYRIRYPCRRHKDWLYRNVVVTESECGWGCSVGDEQKVQLDSRISVQVGTSVIVVLYIQSRNGTQKYKSMKSTKAPLISCTQTHDFVHYINHLNEWPY